MSILSDIHALFFAPTCAVCGEPLHEGECAVCTACRVTAPLTGYWHEASNPMLDKCRDLVPTQHAAALLFFVHKSGWRDLIHAFKYRGRWQLPKAMGAWLGRLMLGDGLFSDVDLVVPLPLHPIKRCLRGYNQSEYLAQGIAEALGIPLERKAVRRVRFTQSQARKSRRERFDNVAHAFAVSQKSRLSGKHILIVDDVFTTGSTVLSCAQAILQAVPDARISIATLAVSRHELGVKD